MVEIEPEEGSCCPLGATWIKELKAYNFALFSQHASGVTLLLFRDRNDSAPQLTVPLRYPGNKTGRVWHCLISESRLEGAQYYGYRVEGPWDPSQGHRFDPRKVLVDPYAKGVVFPDHFERWEACGDCDSAGHAPLGVLGLDRTLFDWTGDHQVHHGSDLIIYEMHIRGFTQHPSSRVADCRRGTYRGVIDKIPYLQQLGVTAVELMPVFQYDPGEQNYWGYMPLNFFTVHHAYAEGGDVHEQQNEFRQMVKALHAAGIEVILDVVYNHTSEGDERGPTHCYRGIDNASYYMLGLDRRTYRNEAGTGNVLNTANPAVRKMVLDSLRYWAVEMRIDGFRFDLASIFTRNADGTLNLDDPPIIGEITSDPALMHKRLIAEAWDPAVYELGRKFPGVTWLQWNGRFRDDVRSFLRGDPALVNPLMTRMYGSDDLFPDTLADAYRPRQSVNYVTSHDGFCLYDLVAYNRKHNEANGYENRDGADDNRSWNCGWEGDAAVSDEVVALRIHQAKNFCCLLFMACGTPMFLAGDEFLNTQKGNNNPFNQDNETTWLDWSLIEKHADFHRFFREMIAFRKRHRILGSSRFWRDRIVWRGVTAEPDRSHDSHTLAYLLEETADSSLYVIVNAYWESLRFELPGGYHWTRVIDTALASPADIAGAGNGPFPSQAEEFYLTPARSVVVFEGRR
jgi:isoamylase